MTLTANAIQTWFNNNKASIPRGQLISAYSSAMGNGSIVTGYFLPGYDTAPYGGFFIGHYNQAWYVGISNGTYSENLLLTNNNYTTYTVTKTGTGASGTWDISITGNAATATTASDSSKLGGLSLGNTTQGSHPGANAVVRTDANGYINCGWINTVSGTATGTPTRIYCSQDAYLRYYAPDDATLRRSMKAYITYSTAAPSGGSAGDIYIQYV